VVSAKHLSSGIPKFGKVWNTGCKCGRVAGRFVARSVNVMADDHRGQPWHVGRLVEGDEGPIMQAWRDYQDSLITLRKHPQSVKTEAARSTLGVVSPCRSLTPWV